MGTKHLSYFKVENFKRFESLEVNDIGQFNLIVGDNNVGKTTLLEALLFDDENYNQCLRNFNSGLGNIRKIHTNKIDSEKINYLNFILNSPNRHLLFFFAYGSDPIIKELSLTTKLQTELTNEELEEIGNYYILIRNEQYLAEFKSDKRSVIKFLYDFNNENTKSYLPFIAFNDVYAQDLVNFFSTVSMSNIKFEEIKETLKYFVPNLTSIEINSSIIKGNTFLVIRESNKDTIQPLTQYGDGFIKFFRCLLEIELCENKRLMIDEIDTGVHYSRIKDFLKNVIQTAKNKNVQIFATTHSKECLEYYKEALKELNMQSNGRIIRLANTKNGIKAYTLKFDEFETALSAENELR